MSLVARTAALFRLRRQALEVGPIGIDFSLECLHLVQLEAATGKPPSVRARVSLPFECPRAEILDNALLFRSLVRRALDKDNFHGRRTVIAIPSGLFRTMSINYTLQSVDESEAEAVIGVMEKRIDGNLADYVIDYLPVRNRSKSDERLALVAISEREAIVNFLELARKSRLDVTALEIGPVALSRLVSAFSTEGDAENVLVINSGRAASYLTLISGTDLLFDQEVTMGEDSLIGQAAETLDLNESMVRDLILRSGVSANPYATLPGNVNDDADLVATISEILKPQFLTLVEEIKRVCLYAAAETRGGGVSRVYLLGSIARWPGSDQLLSAMTGTSVEKIPDPLALFAASTSGNDRTDSVAAPEIAVATGAALRGMSRYERD